MNSKEPATNCESGLHTAQCPNCNSTDLQQLTAVDRFPYGSGKDTVELKAIIPLSRCRSCGLEFSGPEAETKRDEAIRRHLHLLSPQRIADIRASYGLTRTAFSEISRVGLATLVRWENGETLQNRAMDLYMRLLERPENYHLIASGAIFDEEFAQPINEPFFPRLASRNPGACDLRQMTEESKRFSFAATVSELMQ
jgi:putative zinc finger/helix-turn-helix YgiT family protein